MPSHASAPSSPDRTQIYAHRGLAVGQAENTEGAFRRALDAGAHWLETDVNTTADGQVLVFHDPALNRLVGRPGRVAEMTWDQLRDLNLVGGGQISRLRIVDRKLVAAARRAGVGVHVWTIDDERTMRELIALGVNGIVTNRTDLLADVLAS